MATTGDDKANPGGVQRGPVLWVASSTLLVIALGVGVAWELMRTHARVPSATRIAGRFDAPPADMNAIEMGLLSSGVPSWNDQSATRAARPERGGETALTFALRDPRAAAASRHLDDASDPSLGQAAPARRLSSYGWSDRERRRVHIPIARAVELYLARESARPPPPGLAEPRRATPPPATPPRGRQ